MKLFQLPEDATNEKKFMKSRVEKRRRERMNHSLERLRTMLLQAPRQPGGTRHRVEKAEILEHAVLFLQSTAEGEEMRASSSSSAASPPSGGGDGGRTHSLHDGFSTCLQTAARFLGAEGKGLWLGAAALDAASLAASLSPTDPEPGVRRRGRRRGEGRGGGGGGSLPRTKSILRMLRQKSEAAARPAGRPEAPRQNPAETRPASKPSPAASGPVGPTLWRPWP
ncbi:Transcription factor HES-7.1-A [Liparis tanakae]|uniref:Transcription factor HES-7.1-A n=1 Tax=Liparis tanakae TaxID=230148 RepID=A0A4Z2E9N4_9TELE|nr:Transcription factor HES-7.1-A [Liparis tanakae]